MHHLSGLAGGLDARRRMATLARHVPLSAHFFMHASRQLTTPLFPCFSIVEIEGGFRDNVTNSRTDVRICLDKPIVGRDMANPAIRPDARGIAYVRRLQVVRVGRYRRHAVA